MWQLYHIAWPECRVARSINLPSNFGLVRLVNHTGRNGGHGCGMKPIKKRSSAITAKYVLGNGQTVIPFQAGVFDKIKVAQRCANTGPVQSVGAHTSITATNLDFTNWPDQPEPHRAIITAAVKKLTSGSVDQHIWISGNIILPQF